ncbi:MAG: polymerase, sigma-24 subunit, subfamily [Dehalococcoidia bacterium]|nr:polymerase, sigma-24 subunit, subfamily [Dehalococcoidia bacterium]
MSSIGETKGAQEAFAELYDQYLDKVFRYIKYRVNGREVAENLTSTVFEKALVNFAKYNSDRASFSTWLFSIARNVLVDHYRVDGRRHSIPLDDVSDRPSTEISPEEAFELKEEAEKLNLYLAQLPQEEQEIIRLKFAAELNNRQIARMLGLTETNVGTKLYRAVRKLRDSFKEPHNG